MTAVAVRTGMALVLLLVALVLPCEGYAGATTLAQYEAAPQGQYGTPPAGTTSAPEYQYGAPAGGQTGGGGTVGGETTAPARETTTPTGGGNGNGRGPGLRTPNPLLRGDLPAYIQSGFLVDALGLFAVLSLVTTILFLLERRQDRLGR